jgi:hypothetical protein
MLNLYIFLTFRPKFVDTIMLAIFLVGTALVILLSFAPQVSYAFELNSVSINAVQDKLSNVNKPEHKFIENNFEPSRPLSYKDYSHFPPTHDDDIKYAEMTDYITLYGGKESVKLSSKRLDENATFIETRFRVIAEGKKDNHAGLTWNAGNISYYVFLRPHGISAYNDIHKEFARDNQVVRQIGEWQTLRIAFDNNTTDVYLNGKLVLQFPSSKPAKPISNVGIRSYYTTSEFDRIKIGLPIGDSAYVYKDGNNTVVYQDSKIHYNDTDSTTSIQKAVDIASKTEENKVFVSNGRYEIRGRINFTNGLFFLGNGEDTILDYSELGNRNTIGLAPGSRLENIILEGRSENAHEDFTQKIQAADNIQIRNLSISHLGYGIELAGIENATLLDVRCDYLQSENDWSACIHAGSKSRNIKIDGFAISHSNRGIEIEDDALNISARNGFLSDVQNFNGSNHEAFSIDAHTHDGKGGLSNILYENIYLNNSYGPTTKVASQNGNYSNTDLPQNITYRNITVQSPLSPWQINGKNVEIENSRIKNDSGNNFIIYKNSRNILLNGINVHPVFGERYFVTNDEYTTGIYNVTLINNNITNALDKIGPIILLYNIENLTLWNNQFNQVTNEEDVIKLSGIVNLRDCHNTIHYTNGTKETINEPC